MNFKIAFYKGKPSLLARVIRWLDKGPYSHCELVFSDGVWGTAREGKGVLLRSLITVESDWDFVDLPAHLEPAAREWFVQHEGKAYDYVGVVRFLFGFLNPARDKWFCSRACADALSLTGGWRESPNGLYEELVNAAVI